MQDTIKARGYYARSTTPGKWSVSGRGMHRKVMTTAELYSLIASKPKGRG
ncbi:hypothetical protein [Rhizobacter sp. Root1221]|nr:hypothetical protein [Rhizobacter sp. Root1221]